MTEWLVRKVGKGAAWLILVLLVVLLIVGGYMGVKRFFTKDLTTQVKVSRAQTGAAIESGKQAVETVGARSEAEASGAAGVLETKNEIDHATDPGGVTSAGLNGLHRVRGKASPSPRK